MVAIEGGLRVGSRRREQHILPLHEFVSLEALLLTMALFIEFVGRLHVFEVAEAVNFALKYAIDQCAAIVFGADSLDTVRNGLRTAHH